ncbi:MAG: hypothetical protein HXS41_09890 [Theionarchaea archaeon]|nr:hypothetical protein [Theionarchaea archaeon]
MEELKKERKVLKEHDMSSGFREAQWGNSLSDKHRASMGKSHEHTSHHHWAYSHHHMLVLLFLYPIQV